jgi:hypothetical protein
LDLRRLMTYIPRNHVPTESLAELATR